MSDISLNANIYQVSDKYYSIINRFIIAAKTDNEALEKVIRKDILDLFHELSNIRSNDPQIHMISIIIERALKPLNKSIKDITKQLTSDLEQDNLPTANSIKGLETILKALEIEKVKALTRMKGIKR